MGELPAGWALHYDKRLKRFIVITEKGKPLTPSSRYDDERWKRRVVQEELARRRG